MVASKLGLTALQEKPFSMEDIQNMRYQFALDLYQQRIDAHFQHISVSLEETSPSTHSSSSSSSAPPSSPTNRFTHPSKLKKHLPPLYMGPDDIDSEDEEDNEEDNNLQSLPPFQVSPTTQQRLIIPAKPFKQWYILLEHYQPATTTPGTGNLPPLSNEDTDMEDDIFTSPNIGPVTVIKKQVKQTLEVHPIITFLNNPHQYSITIDLKEVPGPATIQYQGTPENRNSSWLDSAE